MFIAPEATLTAISIPWKEEGGYGGGNHGTYTFQLQTDRAGNFPSGTVSAQTTGIIPSNDIASGGDGTLTCPITAMLTAGTTYHLVIFNTDPNYARNWSSPNVLMTRLLPWDGTVGNRAECCDTVNGGGGSWQPWSSIDNIWNTSKCNFINGSHVPLMLSWSDGSNTGDPYYSTAVSSGAYLYGANCAGEYINWANPTVTIRPARLRLRQSGLSGRPAHLHLSLASNGCDLVTGTMLTAAQTGILPVWTLDIILPTPVTLTQGQCYRLWFASPASSRQQQLLLPISSPTATIPRPPGRC